MELSGKFENFLNTVNKGFTTFRDQNFVPALDTAMERGIVPADVGMFGRYLSGTRIPLTKIPADVRQGEQKYIEHRQDLNDSAGLRKKQYDQLKAEQAALGLSFDKDYSTAGNVEREKINRYNELEEQKLRSKNNTKNFFILPYLILL